MRTQTASAGLARPGAERVLGTVLALAALASAGNGAWMLLRPQQWFIETPGAADTGPFNPHLVQDVGIAFLSVGLAYALALWRPAARLPLLLVAAAFLGGHGLLHLAEAMSGHHASDPAGLAATTGIAAFAAVLLLAAAVLDRRH